MNRISRLLPLLAAPLLYGASANQSPGLLSDPVDISSDFHEFGNTYFLADRLAAFDSAKARAASCGGVMSWCASLSTTWKRSSGLSAE